MAYVYIDPKTGLVLPNAIAPQSKVGRPVPQPVPTPTQYLSPAPQQYMAQPQQHYGMQPNMQPMAQYYALPTEVPAKPKRQMSHNAKTGLQVFRERQILASSMGIPIGDTATGRRYKSAELQTMIGGKTTTAPSGAQETQDKRDPEGTR